MPNRSRLGVRRRSSATFSVSPVARVTGARHGSSGRATPAAGGPLHATRRGEPALARTQECSMPEFGPDLVEVFGPSQADGGPELIQLLTPEGERVHHPEFDLDFSAEQLRGFYRDMVLTRRIDTEATALQRHGELGIWAQLLGQEAAQIGAGRALRPQDYVFPTYREHGVAYCRGVDPLEPARPVPRRRPRRLGPQRLQLRPLHDRDRRPGAARHRLRDGHPARRCRRHRRPRPRRRGDRPLRRRRQQPGRRQRGVHLRRVLQRPGRVLLPEQPVGDLRADRAPDPDPALPARARASASPAYASTATTCSRRTPSPRPPCNGPATAAAPRWWRPTPTGWARTPRPTTRRATGSPTTSSTGSSRTRSPGWRSTCAATAWSTTTSSRTLKQEADELGAPPARGRQGAARPEAAGHVRPRLRRGDRGAAPAARGLRGLPRDLRGVQSLSTRARPRRSPSPRASTWACARRWRTTPRS